MDPGFASIILGLNLIGLCAGGGRSLVGFAFQSLRNTDGCPAGILQIN